jgi:hypothetical protein
MSIPEQEEDLSELLSDDIETEEDEEECDLVEDEDEEETQ